ncbi:MAG: DbpA RNA binding domain-containing protein, partial [Fusobacterium polymorphum]
RNSLRYYGGIKNIGLVASYDLNKNHSLSLSLDHTGEDWNAGVIGIVASLLKLSYSDVLDESNYNEISPVKMEDTGKTRLFIAMGRKDGMTPKKLVEFIIKKAKVKQSYIKNAEVYEGFSFVSVPFKEAEIIVEAFAQSRKGKKPLIEKAKTKNK